MRRERGFTMLIQLAIYAAIAAAIAGAAWYVYDSIKEIGRQEVRDDLQPKLDEMTKDRDDTRAKYDRFAADIERKGKEQAARAAEVDAENAKKELERKADYEKRVAGLIADNQRLVARVRDHYTHPGPGTDSRGVPLPEVPDVAGAPGCRPADALLVEGLARDCAVTTAMFLECRDAWKGISR